MGTKKTTEITRATLNYAFIEITVFKTTKWEISTTEEYQLAFLQFFLIWPLVPVSGLRFPIFTIAFAKSVLKEAELEP